MNAPPPRPAIKITLTALTLFVAAALPLTYGLAWHDPAVGAALGLPSLGRLPVGTGLVAIGTLVVQSVLMILVIIRIWRIIGSFTRGVFFSGEVVAGMRSVGRTLIVIALLRTVILPVSILTIWAGGRTLKVSQLWLQIFNLPASILLCGLFAFVIAGAFDRARIMAHDSRFTV